MSICLISIEQCSSMILCSKYKYVPLVCRQKLKLQGKISQHEKMRSNSMAEIRMTNFEKKSIHHNIIHHNYSRWGWQDKLVWIFKWYLDSPRLLLICVWYCTWFTTIFQMHISSIIGTIQKARHKSTGGLASMPVDYQTDRSNFRNVLKYIFTSFYS